MANRSCIDPGEGWDLVCGSCGKRTVSLEPCYWDNTLQVGPWCRIHSDEEACPDLYQELISAHSVTEIRERIAAHIKTRCPLELMAIAEVAELQPIRVGPIEYEGVR